MYVILLAEFPPLPPGRPYHPLTSASNVVDTAPIPNPREPPVVTATLRLSKVTKVPAPTKFEVKFTIPIPLVPEDPEVPEVPEVPAAGVVKEAENHVPEPSAVPC